MKTWLILLGAASLACAEDLKIGSDEYKAVKVLSRLGEKVTLETDAGLVRISIASLPEIFRRTHDLLTEADLKADALTAERARVAALSPEQRAQEKAIRDAEVRAKLAARQRQADDEAAELARQQAEEIAEQKKQEEMAQQKAALLKQYGIAEDEGGDWIVTRTATGWQLRQLPAGVSHMQSIGGAFGGRR